MKRGCILYPLLFLAFLAAWLSFFGRGEPMDFLRRDPASPLVLASVSTLFVAALRGVLVMRRSEAAIEKARKGIPIEDGEQGFAFGNIQPSSDAVLTAPFSGRPAVACEYDVFRETTETVKVPAHGNFSASTETRTTRHSAYTGYAVVPCEVRTPSGPVPLLTRPLLDTTFRATLLQGPEAVERARAWQARTQFENVKDRGLVRELSDHAKSFSRGGGILQRDERHVEIDPDVEGWMLEERIVAPGEIVCAAGTWSGAAGGLLGDSTLTGALQLTPGGAEETAESRGSWRGCLLLVAAALFLLQAFAILRALLGTPVRG